MKISLIDKYFPYLSIKQIETISQFIKYGIVGIFNTVITLVSIYFFNEILMFHYIISNIIGYLLGITNSFFINKLWTFNSKGSTLKESILFVIVFFISYLIQLGLVLLLNEIFRIPIYISTIIGMIMFTIINFAGNKFIVYKNK